MIIHTVKEDESVYKIARQYHTSSEAIIKDNGLTQPDKLVPGQALVILESRHLIMPDEMDEMVHEKQRPEVEKREIIVNGYTYPFAEFLDVMEESLPYLTYLSIFSSEARADGSLVPVEGDAFMREALEHHVSPRMVVSNLGEDGNFDQQLANEILKDRGVQEKLISSIIEELERKSEGPGNGYSGVDIDFENLDPDDRDNYNYFMTELAAELHQEGYTLSAAIEKKTSDEVPIFAAHDYRAHGQFDDLVILMTYDWGYLFGPPMAIAPADQIENVLAYAVTEIPADKILMGIPNYAFDWTLPYEEGTAAAPMSHVEAVDLAWQKGAEIQYDDVAQSPYFHYYDETGKEHEVWFEGARSVYAKLKLVEQYGLGGVSYWTVNKSWPQNWAVRVGLAAARL